MTYGDYHHNAYKAATYREEDKTQQIILLYEGTIRYVKQAKAAIEQNDIEARYNSLTKACEILTGLQLSLDFDHGGEIAQLLYDYYAGLDMRLTHLHFKQDVAICDLCIRHLEMMCDAWRDVQQKTSMDEGGKGGTDTIIGKLRDLASGGTDMSAHPITMLPPELAAINVSA